MIRRTRTVLITLLFVGVLVLQARAADSEKEDRQLLHSLSRAIAKVADEVRPTVVSIYPAKTVKLGQAPDFPDLPFPPPFDFDEFFGERAPRDRNRQTPDAQPKERNFRQRWLGSGFILDAEKGYIVTNHHVVRDADDIKVRLADKREFDAKLVGADEKSDVAVIQIKAKDLKAAKLGDSDKLAVGEFVVAVGSPFGLRETVSLGIVSGKGRSGLGIEDYEDFIQTDAAINMGNSGGPLVNIDGEVVGLNTAILSRTGGSVGVGFAIPINMAKSIIDQLAKTGKVTRGWLGVQIQDVAPEMAEKFGLEKPEGALVSQVFPDTPAAGAGVKPGDVIVEYNGEKVADTVRLRARVAATTPDAKVELVVVRDGKRKTLTVKVAKLTDSVVAAARGETTSRQLGLSVQDLTPDVAKRLGLKAEAGVVVTAVDGAGVAADKGIQPGDLIAEVDRQPVKNVADFEAALKKADLRKGVLLLVLSRDGGRFVVLKQDAKD